MTPDVERLAAVCAALHAKCAQQAQAITALQAHLTSSGPDPRVVALDAQCRQQAQEIARLTARATQRRAMLVRLKDLVRQFEETAERKGDNSKHAILDAVKHVLAAALAEE